MSLVRVSSWRQHSVIKILVVIMSITASVIWGATVTTLFIRWGLSEFVRYDSDAGEVEYISNVAAIYKLGSILGAAVTGISYFLTLNFAKLYFDFEKRRPLKRVASFMMIFFGFISSLSLLLLAIFDSIHYVAVHYTFAGLFIVFTLLTGLVYVVYRFNGDQFNLAVGVCILLIGMIIPLVITFVVCATIGERANRSNLKSVAASIEWAIAILFIVYFSLFSMDIILYK